MSYAYAPPSVRPIAAWERWLRLPDFRRASILRAVEAGEMTQREIAREFNCSLALVNIARGLTRVTAGTRMAGHG